MPFRHLALRATCNHPISLPAKLSRGRRRYCGIRLLTEKQQLFSEISEALTKTGRRDSGLSEGRDSRDTPLLCQAVSSLLWPFSGTFRRTLAFRPPENLELSRLLSPTSPPPLRHCVPRACSRQYLSGTASIPWLPARPRHARGAVADGMPGPCRPESDGRRSRFP